MGTFNDLMAALTAGAITEDDGNLYVLNFFDGTAIYRGPFTIMDDDNSDRVELNNPIKVTYAPEISKSVVPSTTFYNSEDSTTPTEYFVHEADLKQRLSEDISPEEVDKVMGMFSL